MAPHLDRWDRELSEKGLRVVEVVLGPQATTLEELRGHLDRSSARFPVLYDGAGEVTRRFGVAGFPQAFLIDRSGVVRWHGFPNGWNVEPLESMLHLALER